MKIKTKEISPEKALGLSSPAHKKPKKPWLLFRTLLWLLSFFEVRSVKCRYNEIGMEKIGKKTPCLILMNHSCFLDLKIAVDYFYPRPFNIVCTSDGFVGKAWLMRMIGCIPTDKFVSDFSLVKDISHTLKNEKSSVLMYPEASYSFDGKATPLLESVGKLIKMLKVPVVTVITHGVFHHDPLYNGLRLRKTRAEVDVKCFLTPEEAAALSPEEINEKLAKEFDFDNFRWQQENSIKVKEPFRAEGLNRVLYKCPHCKAEGKTEGKGVTLTCHACGKIYTLTEEGYMQADDGVTEFPHIPDWYQWERDEVRREIEEGRYSLDIDVDIALGIDHKAIYKIGEGHLTHNEHGFLLTGCDGLLEYVQSPLSSYSLYADYYWYEIGDMICIGTKGRLFYCFPKNGEDVVAKTRLATEELYKIEMKKIRK